jgi:tRNA threonylcarbamoyladenosine biosynthesis protein TsaE
VIPLVPKTVVPKTAVSKTGFSNKVFSKTIVGEDAMVQLGEALGHSLLSCNSLGEVTTEKSIEVIPSEAKSALVFFEGDLGAGKTTLCRGILQAFGHHGAVKSPTYTLVESYVLESDTGEVKAAQAHHFDLYRLGDPEELEFIGIRDYLEPGNFCLVEWPNRGDGILPAPDLKVAISVTATVAAEEQRLDEGEIKTVGRNVRIVAETERGEFFLSHLIEDQQIEGQGN